MLKEKCDQVVVGKTHQCRADLFPVIAIMGKEIADLAIVGDIALPGT
jgi:hypothetical protein